MDSRRTLLFSVLFLFSLFLSGPLALASPVKRQFTSLDRRLAADIDALWSRDPLESRDVISPKITSPDSSSVWPVGSQQTVTWDTSNLPPDNQITNPIGQIILGFDSGDSLNLNFTNPLAQGFKLRDGNVTITVPNVPPRSDYLIVLLGDSGNTSPSFAITSISGGTPTSAPGSSSSTPSSPTTTTPLGIVAPGIPSPSTPAILSGTTITDPIPISGTTITGADPTATNTQFPSVSDSNLPATSTGPPLADQTSAAAGRNVLGISWTLIVAVLIATRML